jgi:hypothetical protein
VNQESNNEAKDPLCDFEPNSEAPTPSSHGHCTTKPSDYIHRVQSSKGIPTGKPNNSKLPLGMQSLNETSAMANESIEDPGDIEYTRLALSPDVPTTFKEATHSPNKDVWIPAMLEELKRIEKNGTWILVKSPPNANIIGSKWTYLMKRDADNWPVKAKAWLAAQGFSQVPGVDFNETFAPTANPESIRLILALANHNDWSV